MRRKTGTVKRGIGTENGKWGTGTENGKRGMGTEKTEENWKRGTETQITIKTLDINSVFDDLDVEFVSYV